MEVTFLTTGFPAYVGDIKTPFILNLAKAVQKRGVQVNVVAPKYYGGSRYEEIEGVKVYRFDYLKLPFLPNLLDSEPFAKNIFSFLGIIQLPLFLLSFFIRARKPVNRSDLIHCQWIFSSLVAYVYSLFETPYIITSRGEELELIRKSKFKTLLVKFILRGCSYATANNTTDTDILKSFFHSPNKVRFTPNGIDLETFNIIKKPLVKFPKKKFVVLFVGWLIKRKGIDYFVRAINKIVKKNKNFFFVIIGSGELKNFIINYLKKNGLTGYVQLVNKVEPYKVSHFMNAADVLVLPSLAEGRPNVVLEAMACSLPVIATNIRGTNEILESGKNGILIEPKNVNAISEALLNLFTNKKLYNKIKKNSRKSILDSKLNWDFSASNFIKIYGDIVK